MVTRCDYPGCMEVAPLGFYISFKSTAEGDYEQMFEGDFCKKHLTELVADARKYIPREKE